MTGIVDSKALLFNQQKAYRTRVLGKNKNSIWTIKKLIKGKPMLETDFHSLYLSYAPLKVPEYSKWICIVFLYTVRQTQIFSSTFIILYYDRLRSHNKKTSNSRVIFKSKCLIASDIVIEKRNKKSFLLK